VSVFEKVEKLNRAKITLSSGTSVTGESWGIIDAEDDDGEELGYTLLIFKADGYNNPLSLKEEDIKNVEEY
jgi:hypothetical protein